jgi:outer membrane protein assembly factor BamB
MRDRKAASRQRRLLVTAGLVFAAYASWSPPSFANGLALQTTGVDWPTFGDSVMRTGQNTDEQTLGAATVGSIKQKWAYTMSAVVSTSAVEASGVTTALGTQDLVFVGDEHGKFVALNAETGAKVWARNLGSVTTTCNDTPDFIFGITGSPAIDRSTNRIYVVGGNGNLYALNLGTGSLAAGWPVSLTADPIHEHVWGAITASGGKVYAEIGGLCDITPYHGRVIQVDVTTRAISATFYVTSPTKPYGGAIWGWGGASLDPTANALYVATGNALATPQNFGYAEAIVRLDTSLNVVSADHPILNAGKDLDFGSTPVLFQATGCPAQLAAQNKDGELFIYNRDDISSGPAQRIQVTPSAGGRFIGLPAWSDASQELYVALTTNSTAYSHGMLALSESAPSCTLTKTWNTINGQTGTYDSPPTVANGVVYDGNGAGNRVFAFDATTGARLWGSGLTISGPVFAAPIVVNRMLYVSSWDHKLHAYGPPA